MNNNQFKSFVGKIISTRSKLSELQNIEENIDEPASSSQQNVNYSFDLFEYLKEIHQSSPLSKDKIVIPLEELEEIYVQNNNLFECIRKFV